MKNRNGLPDFAKARGVPFRPMWVVFDATARHGHTFTTPHEWLARAASVVLSKATGRMHDFDELRQPGFKQRKPVPYGWDVAGGPSLSKATDRAWDAATYNEDAEAFRPL
jgi:hypothetical protein